jgi:hypothetical protein
MSDEKLRILEMIKAGTLSPQEGLDLIQALDQNEMSAPPLQDISATCAIVCSPSECCPTDDSKNDDTSSGQSQTGQATGTGKKPKWLYIKVQDSESGKNVDIKIPIALAKAASKFIPKEAKAEMHAQGIDIDIPTLLETLQADGQQSLIEVTEGDKKIVKIYTM